jgi:Ricin-type beta-trefoil lectin domain
MSMDVAHADTTVTTCLGASDNSTPYECTLTATISDPASITINVTDDTSGAYEEVTVDVTTLSCTDSTATDSEPESNDEGTTPVTDQLLPLPATADGQCEVEATVDLVPPYSTDNYSECLDTTASPSPVATPDPTPTSTPPACPTEYTATVSYTSAASATSSATAAAVTTVKGYDSMCVDDKGNGSANRTKVLVWKCSNTDQAQGWKLSNGELVHNGKCANDQADGGNGSHVILYSCSSAANDKWSHLSNGELKLKAHSGTLCLNDPGYSKKNGTQLIVYKCTDSANEKWSLP